METLSSKLYSFDEKLIDDCYFDHRKLYIRMPPIEFYKHLYRKPANANSFQYNPSEVYESGNYLHELLHYIYTMTTPIGLFDNIIHFTSLFQTNLNIKLFFAASRRRIIKLPFYNYKNDYSAILSSDYDFSRAITSYLYCFFNPAEMHGVGNIVNFKITEKYPRNLYNISEKRLKKPFKTLLVTFEEDGKLIQKYIPIGLFTILEGYSSFIQKIFYKNLLTLEEMEQDTERLLNDKSWLPYSLLYAFALNEFDGSAYDVFDVIFTSALYLSLMYFSPAFYKRSIFVINLNPKQQIEEFLYNLDHPSNTFLNAFNVLKEITIEDGGIEPGREGVINLINKACKRMEIPPLNLLYDYFIDFMSQMSEYFYVGEFLMNPFAKQFINVSLEFMKGIKKNPCDHIVFWGDTQKKMQPLRPYLIRGINSNNASAEKVRWTIFALVMEQFLHKKRIFCYGKYLFGGNKYCKNDKECSVDKVDYPYSKCDDSFLKLLKDTLGDVITRLVPS